MKKIVMMTILGLIIIATAIITGCKVSEEILAKSGAQLWGENCIRCHNIPSPSDFNDGHWDIIAAHMRVRANLTGMEADKIREFLQSAN